MIKFYHIAQCEICKRETDKLETKGITTNDIHMSLPPRWVCFERKDNKKIILCNECMDRIPV